MKKQITLFVYFYYFSLKKQTRVVENAPVFSMIYPPSSDKIFAFRQMKCKVQSAKCKVKEAFCRKAKSNKNKKRSEPWL